MVDSICDDKGNLGTAHSIMHYTLKKKLQLESGNTKKDFTDIKIKLARQIFIRRNRRVQCLKRTKIFSRQKEPTQTDPTFTCKNLVIFVRRTVGNK